MSDQAMDGVTIRKAKIEDAEAVITMIRLVWDDPDGHIQKTFPLEFSDMFSNATFRPTFFVAEAASRVIGCSFWNWGSASYDLYEFGWMCVEAAHRRCGVGEALHRVRLDDVARHCRENQPYTILLSTNLVERYKRFGFKVISDNPNLMMLMVRDQ